MSQSYDTIQFGSTGDSVRRLQTLLKNQGYNVVIDGSFGAQTKNALMEYQRKNSLTIDGIAGHQTWGALAKSSVSGGYRPSDEVISAKEDLDKLSEQRPGAYKGTYDEALEALYDQISKRPAFSYNAGSDPLYGQYRDQYTTQGRLAMTDTMGRAAGLTGGYGSSYSQNAGHQAYGSYLQRLNDVIPQLYDLALRRYNTEGESLAHRFDSLQDLADQEYRRYNTEYDRWFDAYSRAQKRYDDVREQDYRQYMDMLEFWQKQQAREQSSRSRSSSGSGSRRSSKLSKSKISDLASEFVSLGVNVKYASAYMREWMAEKGIPSSQYDAFYSALKDLNYAYRFIEKEYPKFQTIEKN